MVNKALSQKAVQIYDQKAEERAANAEERSKNEVFKGFPKRLNLSVDDAGKPRVMHVSTLHDSDSFLNLQVHFDFNPRTKKREVYLCDKTYEGIDPAFADSCEKCNNLDDKGSNPKPSLIKTFLGYVHNYEGEVFVVEEGNNKGKEYPISPERVVEIRSGKGKVNFQEVDTIAQKGGFKPGKFIFEMKKTGLGTETQYHAPTIVHPDMLGDEFNPSSKAFKDTVAKYGEKSIDDIWTAILVNYQNVKWDLWGLDKPTAPVGESNDAKSTDSTSKKAKKSLDE